MARKRKTRKDDPNQLMLFSSEEMSGEAKHSDLSESSESSESSAPLDLMEERSATRSTPTTCGGVESDTTSESVEPKPDTEGVELMSKVIRLLDGFSPGKVRLIAMQSSALVQGGVDSLEHYCIPALPEMSLRGDSLERIAYVSLARSFPHMIDKLGLDFSSEYEEAESV